MDEKKRGWSLTRGRKSPCMECKNRHLGCHGKCDDYQKFVSESHEIYKKRKQGSELIDTIRESMDRARKQRHSNPKVFKMHKK